MHLEVLTVVINIYLNFMFTLWIFVQHKKIMYIFIYYILSSSSYQINAAYDDLLLHNNVRWLSKGRVLERFWDIRKDLEMFLSQQKNAKARHYLDFLRNDDSIELVAFIVDVTSHLNELNLRLQGQGNTECDLMAAVRSFERWLEIFKWYHRATYPLSKSSPAD